MNTDKIASDVAMHITYGCLVVPVDVELYDDTVLHIREEILAKVRETRVKGGDHRFIRCIRDRLLQRRCHPGHGKSGFPVRCHNGYFRFAARDGGRAGGFESLF